MAAAAQANTQRKWDFSAHFSTVAAAGGGIPMTGTGAIWMISIWHSSTFSHRWFRFELLVHLDLCCWFNKQTQYIVHHANCIKKLLTSFQISSFYSSVPLSFPSFPLFSPSSNPNPAFSFSPKLDPIRDQIISEVSLTGLQTGLCYRIFPEVVWEITANTWPPQRKLGYHFTLALSMKNPALSKAPDFFPSCSAFVKGCPKWGSWGLSGSLGHNKRPVSSHFHLLEGIIMRLGNREPAHKPWFQDVPVVCQCHPQSLRFHPERKTPWDFCKILLSCSNGSSSESGELLCYQCCANCSSISLLQCLPPLTRLSNKFVWPQRVLYDSCLKRLPNDAWQHLLPLKEPHYARL